MGGGGGDRGLKVRKRGEKKQIHHRDESHLGVVFCSVCA